MTARAMVVVGGGSSRRFGSDKMLADIAGLPLIVHSIDAVVDHVDKCIVVCRTEIMAEITRLRPGVEVVPGGATRTGSEIAGLRALTGATGLIGIHDAARPLVDPAIVEHLFEGAATNGGAVPLLATQSLIVDRANAKPMRGLCRAQTPQIFRAEVLLAAYSRAAEVGYEGYDTVDVVQEFADVEIVGVEGDPDNVKVTYPEDLDRVRRRLTDRSGT